MPIGYRPEAKWIVAICHRNRASRTMYWVLSLFDSLAPPPPDDIIATRWGRRNLRRPRLSTRCTRQCSRRQRKATPATTVRQRLSRCICTRTLTDTGIRGRQVSKGGGGFFPALRSPRNPLPKILCPATAHLDRGADPAGHRTRDGARSGGSSSGWKGCHANENESCESRLCYQALRRPFLSPGSARAPDTPTHLRRRTRCVSRILRRRWATMQISLSAIAVSRRRHP
jgi:hypothetical protein